MRRPIPANAGTAAGEHLLVDPFSAPKEADDLLLLAGRASRVGRRRQTSLEDQLASRPRTTAYDTLGDAGTRTQTGATARAAAATTAGEGTLDLGAEAA